MHQTAEKPRSKMKLDIPSISSLGSYKMRPFGSGLSYSRRGSSDSFGRVNSIGLLNDLDSGSRKVAHKITYSQDGKLSTNHH